MEATDENFEKEVIEKSKKIPVIVDFWAEWCMPCQMIMPILEKIAQEYSGKIEILKANVDKAKQKSQQYKVMSIPNVKIFKQGEIVDEFVGVISEEEIKKKIEKVI